MLLAEDLKRVTWHCVHFVSPGDESTVRAELESNSIRVFEIQGPSIETQEHLFSALAKEMRFPDYFGMNWDALDECLRDMEWLPAKGYVLFFYGSGRLWKQAARIMGAFLESWLLTAEEWSREGVPFHVVFVW